MPYLLNYKKWSSLYEAAKTNQNSNKPIFEATTLSDGSMEGDIQVQFLAGAYGAAQAEQDQLIGQIRTSLTPFVEFIKNPAPDYFGHFINIEVEASADAQGLSAEALQRSAALGITAQMQPAQQNTILSNARKDTCIKLMIKILTEDLGVTEEELKTKITISGKATVSPKINDPSARFVKARLSKGAQYLPLPPPEKLEEDVIACGYSESKSGVEAKKYPFIGYEKKVKTSMRTGQKMTLSFNALQFPDAFYVKYGNVEKFSGFIGAEEVKGRDFNVELSNYGYDLKEAVDATIKRLGGKIESDLEQDFKVSGTPTQMTALLKKSLKESKLDPKYYDWALMIVGYLNDQSNRSDGVLGTTWVQNPGEAIALPPDEYLIGSKSQNSLMLKTLLASGHIGLPDLDAWNAPIRDDMEGTRSDPTENDLKKLEEEGSKWKKVKWTIDNAAKFAGGGRSMDGSTIKPRDITKEKNYIPITREIVLEMIKSGSLGKEVKNRRNLTPNPANKNMLDFNFTFEKDFKDEYLTIVVFSPLAGTVFKISASCR